MAKLRRKEARQRAVFKFIRKRSSADSVAPSVEEIRRYFGWKSRTSVTQVLDVLEKEHLVLKLGEKRFRYKLAPIEALEHGLLKVPVLTVGSGGKLDLGQKSRQSFLVDRHLHGFRRSDSSYIVRFGKRPPENGLISNKNESVLVIPWEPKFGGQSWVLADDASGKASIYFRHKVGRRTAWLTNYRDDDGAGRPTSEFAIHGKVVAVFLAAVT